MIVPIYCCSECVGNITGKEGKKGEGLKCISDKTGSFFV